jgi:hypothetical protein
MPTYAVILPEGGTVSYTDFTEFPDDGDSFAIYLEAGGSTATFIFNPAADKPLGALTIQTGKIVETRFSVKKTT